MRKDLHPNNYRTVVFQDLNDNTTFITKSTAASTETIDIDGQTLPLIKVHISSATHPFYTGKEKLVDIEGRVDKFKARQEAAVKKRTALINKAKKSMKKSDNKQDAVQKIGTKSISKRPASTAANKKPIKPLVEKAS